MFEVVCSHTTRSLHVSYMLWGACGESLIVKYDEVVHELMDGRFSLLPVQLIDIHGNTITVYGYYFICDGGYPKLQYFVCLYKWPQSGTDMERWSDACS
jgi:hypothetical protein